MGRGCGWCIWPRYRRELAPRKAEEFGFEKSSGDWRALIADPEVEVVSVTTPNAFHAEMAIAALEAGKHVWCEKPMAVGSPMRSGWRRRRSVGQGGGARLQLHPEPGDPAYRALLDEGAIGEVNHVRFEMDEDFMADPEAPFYWKSEA